MWGRSLLAALAVHAGFAFWMLEQYTAVPTLAQSSLGAIARQEIQVTPVPAVSVVEAMDSTKTDSDAKSVEETTSGLAPGTAVEPDFAFVKRAAQSMLAASEAPGEPGAMDELARKARVLEQISSAEEVARITSGLRDALSAAAVANPSLEAHSDSLSFDYDHCLLTNSKKLEKPGEIEIQETLTDPAGRFLVISYIRRIEEPSGESRYFQAEKNRKGEREEFPITKEDFEDAFSRNKPYQIINQFSLVRQIHDQAVLPILQKLADEADKRPATPDSNPGGSAE